VEHEGRVPVADVFKERTHAERRAAVAARIRALELDALAADEARQQAVVAYVQTVEREEAGVRVEAAGPALHEIEHGLVEHGDGDLDRLATVALARRGRDRDANRVARLVDLLRRRDLDVDALVRI